MKKILLACLSVISLTAAAPAAAQFYLGAGIAVLDVDAQGGASDNRTIGMLTAGYKAGWFAGEAFCGGSKDCGVGALAHLEVAPGLSAFGRVSAHHMKGTIDIPGGAGGRGGAGPTASSSVSWSGWTPAIGVGMQYVSQRHFGGRVLLEQTRGVDQLDRARIVSANLLYSF